MTHTSKKFLPKSVTNSLSSQLVSLFTTADTRISNSILTCFFTESEQVMFVKRLAILIMLEKGYSKYRIAKTLMVSESTVKIFSVKYQSGLYDSLITVTKKKEFDKKKFWKTVEIILRAGLPPRGKDRWSYAFPKEYCD